MKTKYTTGPWQVVHSESKNAWNVIGTMLGGKFKLAKVPYILMERKDDNDSFNRAMRREAEADAKLIAAAPELLEALKLCVKRMEELQENTNYPLAWPRVAAQEAINKATL